MERQCECLLHSCLHLTQHRRIPRDMQDVEVLYKQLFQKTHSRLQTQMAGIHYVGKGASRCSVSLVKTIFTGLGSRVSLFGTLGLFF